MYNAFIVLMTYYALLFCFAFVPFQGTELVTKCAVQIMATNVPWDIHKGHKSGGPGDNTPTCL